MRVRLSQLLFSFLVFLLAAEAGSFLVAKYLQYKAILYRPHSDISDYDTYLQERDPELGWIKLADEDNVLPDGSRYSPAIPASESRPPCVSLYGDSFVWADEVDDSHAWGNLLARQLGCRVANFGVRAYGTDQSYLRYHYSSPENSGHVIILGHLSENILRNLTQDFDLLYGLTKYGLKPRFILDSNNQIELIPLPRLSREEFARLNNSPQSVLAHEYLVPLRADFPYTLSVVRALGSYRIQARLRGELPWAAFYRENHPSHALLITAGIMSAFVKEAKARGDKPLVLLIPHMLDLRYFRETGTWVYEPLIKELEKLKIPFVNAGPGLLEALQGRDLQSIYAPRSHFNEEGNRLLEGVVFNALQERGLAPPMSAISGGT